MARLSNEGAYLEDKRFKELVEKIRFINTLRVDRDKAIAEALEMIWGRLR